MVSGRSTDGQGQSKVLIPPENVVCGKVMFSVVSVYQSVRGGGGGRSMYMAKAQASSSLPV